MQICTRRVTLVLLQLAMVGVAGCDPPHPFDATSSSTAVAATTAPTPALDADETLAVETADFLAWDPLNPNTPLARAAEAELPGVAVIRLWSGDGSVRKLRILTRAEERADGNYPPGAFNKRYYADEHNTRAVGARTYDYNYNVGAPGFLVAKCVLRKIGGSWVLMSSTGNPAHCHP